MQRGWSTLKGAHKEATVLVETSLTRGGDFFRRQQIRRTRHVDDVVFG